MSSPNDSHDRRQLSPREEFNVYDRVFDAIIYYGLSQVLALAAPMLWIVYLTPIDRIQVTAGALAFIFVAPVVIAALRMRVVETTPAWMNLDAAGWGTPEGFRTYLNRAMHLNSSVAYVAFGVAALVRVLPLPSLSVWPLAVAATAATVLAHTRLAQSTIRARVARLAYHAGALALVVLTTPPMIFVDVGFYSFPFTYATLCLLALLDVRPLFGTVIRSLRS